MGRYLRGFGQLGRDFVVGGDWKVATAVVLVLAVGVVLGLSWSSLAR